MIVIKFKSLLSNPQRGWKQAAFSVQFRSMISTVYGYSMRTAKYRYTEWHNNTNGAVLAKELYDLVNDPLETKNIAVNLTLPFLEQLSEQLHAGWKAALLEGVVNQSNNPVVPSPYAWGPEGVSRRREWHLRFGGQKSDNWRELTKKRLSIDGAIY